MATKKRLSRPFGRRSALLIIDVQNDFVNPNGSLYVPDAEATIPTINTLRAKVGWDLIAHTADWHPKGHCSFLSTALKAGTEASLFDTITLPSGTPQVMWPEHCLQESEGATFHENLVVDPSDKIVKKGQNINIDSYSGFCDNDGVSKTEMAKLLRQANVTDVYITGVAFDYCVGFSAIDSANEGFNTFVIQDATRPVAAASASAMEVRLEKAGVKLITSSVLLQQLEHKDDRRHQAADYMEEHSIPLLFQKLCTSLIYHKPQEPKQFLIKELQKLQKQRRSELSRLSLLTDEDMETMFNMLDPIGKGQLTSRQVLKALAGLGLQPSQEVRDDDTFNVTKFKQVVLAAQAAS